MTKIPSTLESCALLLVLAVAYAVCTQLGQIAAAVYGTAKFYAFKENPRVANLRARMIFGAFYPTVSVFAEDQQPALGCKRSSSALILVVHSHAMTRFHAYMVHVSRLSNALPLTCNDVYYEG